MSRIHGQSLAEYGIIIVMVAVAGIAGLMLIGQSIQGEMAAMLGGQVNGSQAVNPSSASVSSPPGSTPAPNTASSVGTPSPASNPVPLSGATTVTFQTADGKTFSLPGYPQDLSKSVLTAGANGTTSLLANQLQAIAKQLLDGGEIDQAQHTGLIGLANQGHRLAEILKLAESTATTASTNSFHSSNVVFDGKTMNVNKLAALVGDQKWTHAPSLTQSSVNEDAPELMTFINLYIAAENNGTLADPAVKTVVESLSSQIVSINYAMWNGMGAIESGLPPAELTKNVASQLTHQNSAGICTTGNAQDSGIHCSG